MFSGVTVNERIQSFSHSQREPIGANKSATGLHRKRDSGHIKEDNGRENCHIVDPKKLQKAGNKIFCENQK